MNEQEIQESPLSNDFFFTEQRTDNIMNATYLFNILNILTLLTELLLNILNPLNTVSGVNLVHKTKSFSFFWGGDEEFIYHICGLLNPCSSK